MVGLYGLEEIVLVLSLFCRCERLEEQLNDLTELHQNEILNLKQELASMEEKIAYQSYERARDIQVTFTKMNTGLVHATAQTQIFLPILLRHCSTTTIDLNKMATHNNWRDTWQFGLVFSVTMFFWCDEGVKNHNLKMQVIEWRDISGQFLFAASFCTFLVDFRGSTHSPPMSTVYVLMATSLL